jgi:hypothetical protein
MSASTRSIVDAARRSRSRGIQQTIQSLLDKARTPLGHRLLGHPLARSDILVVGPLGTGQHDARTQGQRLRRLASQCQRHELLSFGLTQHQLCLRSSCHLRLVVFEHYTTDLRR